MEAKFVYPNMGDNMEAHPAKKNIKNFPKIGKNSPKIFPKMKFFSFDTHFRALALVQKLFVTIFSIFIFFPF